MSKTGYKKPPVESQFKPGQSGNPKGRPKGSVSFGGLATKELSQKMLVSDKGEPQKYSARRIIVKTMVHKAMKGDLKAIEALMKLEGLDQQNKQHYERQELSPEAEEAILERFLKRQGGGN